MGVLGRTLFGVEFNINICFPLQGPDRVAGCTSIDILREIVKLVQILSHPSGH